MNYGCGTGHYLSLADLGGQGGSGEQGGAGGFEDFFLCHNKIYLIPNKAL